MEGWDDAVLTRSEDGEDEDELKDRVVDLVSIGETVLLQTTKEQGSRWVPALINRNNFIVYRAEEGSQRKTFYHIDKKVTLETTDEGYRLVRA